MGKKIVLAFDSFKGSLSSLQAGEAAVAGIKAVMPEIITEIVPVADGGEGTVESVVTALRGKYVTANVTDPVGNSVRAVYGICGETAVVEMASASGLTLVPKDMRNPWLTTSYGTGELIRDALNKGCRKFLIGIGGSATNDGGVGMLSALGFRFLDAHGFEVGAGGGETGRIVTIDSSHITPGLKEATFTIACDVTNPLIGPQGASYIFGPQKGADKEMVLKLDKCLHSFANVVKDTFGIDYSLSPGTGAAGGLGFAFRAFLNAQLKPGIEMVLDALNFDSKLKEASLVFTGEGCLDKQTIMGKTPYGVLKRAEAQNIPVIAVGGSLENDAVPSLLKAGFKAVFPIVASPVAFDEALKPEVASLNMKRTVSQILNIIKYIKID